MPRSSTQATRARRKRGARVSPKLATYQAKRDFVRTPEPSGRARRTGRRPTAPRSGRAKPLQFVVQKHAARQLHYDFRLEFAGVLLSWSVPKGPSLKPGLRRLAVRTEDHPLDYADFEGIIPKGQYGGGTVIVWDRGHWQPEGDPLPALESGRLTFELHGEKLRGRFHLVRTRPGPGGKREQWLLFKGKGEGASDSVDILERRSDSVLSGRSLEAVSRDPERVWNSKQTASASRRATAAPANPHRREPPRSTVELVKRLPLPFELTNLDKPLYPEARLLKADVIAYYATIAPHMLPHVRKRPLTLVRCPNGAGTKCFYQKHANDTVPDVIERIEIDEAGSDGADYMLIRDRKGLIALAQLGVLEVHTWGCHAPSVERPDKLVFDLDPGEQVPWAALIEAAAELRQRLFDLDLQSFVQTTGGKGLHVVVPLKPKLDWDEHKQFSKVLAESMASAQPDRYLTNMRKSLRKGRIFLDYLRNGRGATAVAPYSTRARSGATVAAPLTWDELLSGAKSSDFTLRSMIERMERIQDPWEGYHTLRQTISRAAWKSLGA